MTREKGLVVKELEESSFGSVMDEWLGGWVETNGQIGSLTKELGTISNSADRIIDRRSQLMLALEQVTDLFAGGSESIVITPRIWKVMAGSNVGEEISIGDDTLKQIIGHKIKRDDFALLKTWAREQLDRYTKAEQAYRLKSAQLNKQLIETPQKRKEFESGLPGGMKEQIVTMKLILEGITDPDRGIPVLPGIDLRTHELKPISLSGKTIKVYRAVSSGDEKVMQVGRFLRNYQISPEMLEWLQRYLTNIKDIIDWVEVKRRHTNNEKRSSQWSDVFVSATATRDEATKWSRSRYGGEIITKDLPIELVVDISAMMGQEMKSRELHHGDEWASLARNEGGMGSGAELLVLGGFEV